MDPLFGMGHPLTYQGWVNRLLEGHSMGESRPQEARCTFFDRDDVGVHRITVRDLNHYGGLDGQHFGQQDFKSTGINDPGSAGEQLRLRSLSFEKGASDG